LSANNKKSPEDLIYLLDLKPGGKHYERATWVAKRTTFKSYVTIINFNNKLRTKKASKLVVFAQAS